MLKTVPIRDLKPNPFRRLDEYPIIREKVDALKESIAATGFWGTIVARPAGKQFEIAFGHHRMVALREALDAGALVEIIVRDLTNEQMLQMMARENMEEWGTSAWVEVETVRSVIDAYGKGEIELPDIPSKTNDKAIRYASATLRTHPFTKGTVAQFLGWTFKHHDGLQPNRVADTAFKALDMIDKGLLKEADLKGLTRRQMQELVDGAMAIHRAHEREAEAQREAAERAKQQAAEADETRERQRYEKAAKMLEDQARWAEADAKEKPKQFTSAGADHLRQGEGVRSVRTEAERYKPSTSTPDVPSADKHALKLVKAIHNVLNGDDNLSAGFDLLLKSVDPKLLSAKVADEIDLELNSLIGRLEALRKKFKSYRVR